MTTIPQGKDGYEDNTKPVPVATKVMSINVLSFSGTHVYMHLAKALPTHKWSTRVVHQPDSTAQSKHCFFSA